MNEDKYPDCPCGERDWRGGGGQLGPGYHFTGGTCGACGNHFQEVGRDGWQLLLIAHPDLADELLKYVNGSLIIQARAYKAVWEPAAKAREDTLYRALVGGWGVNPTEGCKHHYLDTKYTKKGTRADGTTYEYEASDFEYRDDEGNVLDIDHHAFREACEKMWDANPRRPDIVRAPDPLNVPDEVLAYVWRGGAYELVDPADPACTSVSALLGMEVSPLPPDPLRVGWVAYFDEVFEQVSEATGQAIARVEVDNRYYNDRLKAEPWWEFCIGDAKFVVGPRKRVINIEFEVPEPIRVDALAALAKEDSVTFSADPVWLAGAKEAAAASKGGLDEYKAILDAAEAAHADSKGLTREVCIHAWTKAKLIEYLTVAFETVG